ncbi:uncharacterized protein LOC118506895 [Anopheles stephensi]|uniref:uncharacterized protein LOC118506895 n=1 Tax=Anopheles stephensi TaxID=30069 RepID=UPI001658A7BC|nr:uncharacterized protein LOC118506895 [Anopheles stephensi]
MAELCNLLTCRLCLQKQFQLLPMFPANEPVNDELLRKIYECAAVRISYEYDQSSVICIKCIVDVEQFYAFKQRCMESDSLFQKMRLGGNDRGLDESEFEHAALPDTEFMEPITNLESPQQYDAPRTIESFIGGASKLLRVGYNYRIVRVNDECDVLVYRKHRFYQPTKATDWNRWICVANSTNSCPARLTISSRTGFPVALFSKRIQHNHSEALVQTIDSAECCQEEVVQALPSYTFVLDADRRLRLLAEGYRYRLRKVFCGAGKSVWSCVRPNCTASIELSYDDLLTCTTSNQPHSHEVEETVPTAPSNPNNELMAQQHPKREKYGLNYYIADGVLVYGGNYFKALSESEDNSATSVWKCTVKDCAAKIQLHVQYAAMINGSHNHVKQITKNRNQLVKRTIQQGVNYRLFVEEHGFVRLQYRKQRYTYRKLLPSGTSEWTCIWKGLGCTALLRMLPDGQLVYSCTEDSVKHEHRVGNALETHFPLRQATQRTPSCETNLWTTSAYELLWNRNSKPIIHRHRERYYAHTAFTHGTTEWHCVRGKSTLCEATITIDKYGEIVAEHAEHVHEKKRKNGLKVRCLEQNPSTRTLFTSPGPVRLLAGGFNYRRMHDDHLNIDIVVHVAHKYLSDGPGSNVYHCIMRNEPQACPGKIILTNYALCAEILATHNHLARSVPKLPEPDRSAQVIVDGRNYELIYSMTGRNCLLLHEGHVFRMYKLLEPSQTSRWRCTHAEVGCKAFLSVPLTLTKPATMDAHPHDHSRVRSGDGTTGLVKVKQEIVEETDEMVTRTDCMQSEQSHRLRPRLTPKREPVAITEDVKRSLALINPTTSDASNPLSLFQDIRGTLIKEEMKREMMVKPDPDAMTCFLNGQLYVRQFEDLETLDAPEWMCAFQWTLNCNARLSDLSAHTHERFASVRTNDRFNMLKTLIARGLIGQRGVMTQMPERQKVSEYELLPSNGNLSLIIDENRYYFYKAKNNGEWLWRCVRYRWQGCKIGVAVSHCFGKYYYQPYGNKEHVHSS